ncbi:MAG: MlaD family protein [Candidatus Cloacimonetes bacterium]|nr:MlaD family protein [Candidatus Cloacimonadota bacterium]MDD3142900.1 MlaD family protein [Candidatus Cloacimonadota bacterium]MDY0367841.1 MlaD family protein [Candidatus Syntrophosphaera sp.]HOY84545.1 MlaD family protein [Candidatus Syntrophosphaera sp.]HPH61157.1 MlaD family protein [Candidatus Syntrophosphaera sp.]
MKRFYPNIRKTQLKVGLFTVVILAALVISYLWLSSRISTRAQTDLRLSFGEVMGLEVGDQVTFRGMEVGRVKKIEARDRDILVTARINSDISLKEGSRFIIADSGLMGGTLLNISPGEGPGLLNTKQVLAGDSPLGIMSVIGQATLALDEIKTVFASLRGEDGLIGKSTAVLDNAQAATAAVDQLALGARNDLEATLDQIERLTGEVRSVVQASSADLESTLGQAPEAMARASAALDSLKVLSAKLDATMRALNSGQGTAGKLLRDDELYRQLQGSVASLDSLVADVRANPKKYLKFSIF